jgi:HK97 family phage prohead protease
MDHLDLSMRFEASGDEGQFTGHAVIWDERNAHNETVQRGAFKRSLAEHRQAGTRPLMLWSHNPSEVIGVWTEVREDATGLAVTGKIVTTTVRGREAYDLIKAGALNGLSIGFRARADKRAASGVRVLTDIDLAEISIVGLPSAGRARITSIRSSGRSVESAAAFIEACRKAKCALVSKGK